MLLNFTNYFGLDYYKILRNTYHVSMYKNKIEKELEEAKKLTKYFQHYDNKVIF